MMVKGTPVEIAGKKFSKKGDARDFIDDIRKSYDPGDDMSAEHTVFLMEAIKAHATYATTFPKPVTGFYVGRADYGTFSLFAQMDGMEPVKFSARGLVPTTPRKKSES